MLNQTIAELSKQHLIEKNGLLAGQCLTAVGWVGGTVPQLSEEEGIVELSMADVAGGGIVSGLAVAQRKPIYVVRYQGFLWYNLVTVANYCAKSEYLWGVPAPIWVRAICMEGAIGPVAGNGHHSMAARMPNIKVIAPATDKEYREYFKEFQSGNGVYVVSEHRRLFTNEIDITNITKPKSKIVILAISATRIDASIASQIMEKEGVSVDYIGIITLSPLEIPNEFKEKAEIYTDAIILDVDYREFSISSQLELSLLRNYKHINVHNLALEKRTAGFSVATDLKTPTPVEIVDYVRSLTS